MEMQKIRIYYSDTPIVLYLAFIIRNLFLNKFNYGDSVYSFFRQITATDCPL